MKIQVSEGDRLAPFGRDLMWKEKGVFGFGYVLQKVYYIFIYRAVPY